MFTERVHNLKQCPNLKLHDANYTSLLSHYSSTKLGGGEGGAHFRGGAYFKFRPIRGVLIQRGRLFEGRGLGANSKIYGNCILGRSKFSMSSLSLELALILILFVNLLNTDWPTAS